VAESRPTRFITSHGETNECFTDHLVPQHSHSEDSFAYETLFDPYTYSKTQLAHASFGISYSSYIAHASSRIAYTAIIAYASFGIANSHVVADEGKLAHKASTQIVARHDDTCKRG
jgi:hypothetical protein